jgi:1-phosphofructokinase
VDLSTPRLDHALEGAPDLVKINDWELAEYVYGPVSEPAEMRAAAQRLRDAGAGTVVITRAGDPAFVLDGDREFDLVPPKFDRGAREGCGDSMMGGVAAGPGTGDGDDRRLVLAQPRARRTSCATAWEAGQQTSCTTLCAASN